ncbi:MAG: Mini-ribonuclease 3 [Clostridium sp.]
MEFELLKNKFSKTDAKQLNPLVLALAGDAVYEVFIRTYLIEKFKGMNVNKLHKKTVSYVKAKAQCEYMKQIIDDLNEDEMAIFKRGRNTKSHTPKNGDVVEYKWATGFEALIGYLYLSEDNERLNYMLNKIVKYEEEKENVES